jgi:hypothetical protein
MVTVKADPAHGGRWTSLRAGCRDWLWHRVEPGRLTARPGDPFADAGGVEECIPTVRGKPDHGEAWSRRWVPLGPDAARVDTDEFTLYRVFRREEGALVVSYRLTAQPGWPFVWAAHALLDLSPAAVLEAPAGTVTRIDDGSVTTWPTPLASLGPDDGSATGAILVDCPQVTVADGERLTFSLEAPGQPVSVALWRNLRGWPAAGPYRSIGVEPMLGRVFDRADAAPGDVAIVPPSGVCEWQLKVTGA